MWCMPDESGFCARMATRPESVLKRIRPPDGCCPRLQTGARNESLSRSGKRRNAGLSSSYQASPLTASRASGKLMCCASAESVNPPAACAAKAPQQKAVKSMIGFMGFFITRMKHQFFTLRNAPHAARSIFTLLASPFTFHASRFTFHVPPSVMLRTKIPLTYGATHDIKILSV